MARDRTHDSSYDWWFRNRETGRITMRQPANRPIKVVTAATIVGVLLPRGRVRDVLGEVAVVMLAWWAVDEVARGVNPYRRVTGGVALGGLAILVLNAIRLRNSPRKKKRK